MIPDIARSLYSFNNTPYQFGSVVRFLCGDFVQKVGVMVSAEQDTENTTGSGYSYRVATEEEVELIKEEAFLDVHNPDFFSFQLATYGQVVGPLKGMKTQDLRFHGGVACEASMYTPGDLVCGSVSADDPQLRMGVVVQVGGEGLLITQGGSLALIPSCRVYACYFPSSAVFRYDSTLMPQGVMTMFHTLSDLNKQKEQIVRRIMDAYAQDGGRNFSVSTVAMIVRLAAENGWDQVRDIPGWVSLLRDGVTPIVNGGTSEYPDALHFAGGALFTDTESEK